MYNQIGDDYCYMFANNKRQRQRQHNSSNEYDYGNDSIEMIIMALQRNDIGNVVKSCSSFLLLAHTNSKLLRCTICKLPELRAVKWISRNEMHDTINGVLCISLCVVLCQRRWKRNRIKWGVSHLTSIDEHRWRCWLCVCVFVEAISQGGNWNCVDYKKTKKKN